MKWKRPNSYSERIIIRFLFFPRTIQGETRWLEFARIKQYYWLPEHGPGWWTDKEWMN